MAFSGQRVGRFFHAFRAFAVGLGAMRFDIVTIFPEFFAGPLEYGIVRRAREAGAD